MTANSYRPAGTLCRACGKPKDMRMPCQHCGYNAPMEEGVNGLPNLF